MNKFDTLLYDYLVSQREVAIAKIGVLHATAESITVAQGNEQVSIPKVHFTYNRRTETSAGLIAFIAEKIGKNKMLIEADLDSYFEQVRQFINLGKPYLIPQIGAITLNKLGEYEFSQQNNEVYANEEKAQRQYYQSESGHHNEAYRARSKNRIAGIAIVIIALIIGGLGWGAYTLFFNKSKAPAVVNEPVGTPPAAAQQPAATIDSSGRMPDSLAQKQAAASTQTTAAPAPAGNGQWKFVFETTTSSERAHTRTAQLLSFGDPAEFDSIRENNAFVYRLYFKAKATPADTTRVRDSLATYFQRRVVVIP
ncbi:hypothetical protein [Deminuibacter soli]|uniref:CCDC81-like prokaryotic HU domain-containing protein n=1 Tax=Deminuibacter soli TaxID=2291815 RepID=A0A3E1NJQ3_9BACT|nr:hypothetical protein [Deminuibacter soli]RFM28152.1 hypothetical protein DXN05_11535 [Deminuibacter soli]